MANNSSEAASSGAPSNMQKYTLAQVKARAELATPHEMCGKGQAASDGGVCFEPAFGRLFSII
jgi:hypothetical protein